MASVPSSSFGFKRVVKRKREVSLAKLAQAVGALDGKVFAEIKSFKDPPDQIYLVMKVCSAHISRANVSRATCAYLLSLRGSFLLCCPKWSLGCFALIGTHAKRAC